MVVNDPNFGDANRKMLGFTNLSEIVLQKNFDLKPNITFDVDIKWYWQPNYGNCYQFNGPILPDISQVNNSIYSQCAIGDYYGFYFK